MIEIKNAVRYTQKSGSRNEFYVTSTFLCLHLYPVYKNKRKNRWQDAESNFWKLRQTGGQKIFHKTREKVLSIPWWCVLPWCSGWVSTMLLFIWVYWILILSVQHGWDFQSHMSLHSAATGSWFPELQKDLRFASLWNQTAVWWERSSAFPAVW